VYGTEIKHITFWSFSWAWLPDRNSEVHTYDTVIIARRPLAVGKFFNVQFVN